MPVLIPQKQDSQWKRLMFVLKILTFQNKLFKMLRSYFNQIPLSLESHHNDKIQDCGQSFSQV